MRTPHAVVATGLLVAACSARDDAPAAAPSAPNVVADLRADSNRDGEIHFDDDTDAEKTVWDRTHGAVFLANIDDDASRCKDTGDDYTLPRCNDAQDDIVNGEDDAKDLARLKTRPWADAPEGTTARVAVDTEAARDRVRLFKRTGDGPADFEVLAEDAALSLEEVQAGVELAIEAKDIVRDPSAWDGYVDVRLTVTTPSGEASDVVKLRVAPVLTFHHLDPVEKVWVSDTGTAGNAATRKDLAASCSASQIDDLETVEEEDPWTQDFFETGYMSMPGEGGAQHVMRVNYRSANVFEPNDKHAPLRPAGQLVWRLRGKDVAGVQQFDPGHDLEMDSLNSFGNLETVPPYTAGDVKYPFGRLLRGSTKSFFPDKSFEKMLEAQGQQPVIDIDTSWLLVGHVDETLSFVKADTPRGWVLLANDARLAKQMLDAQVAAGHGDVAMFVGKSWFDFDTGEEKPAQVTISQVLADVDVMKASAEAAAEVDAQLAVLKKEVGLKDDEIVRVPFLHTSYGGLSVAYQPAMVNGLYLTGKRFLAPDPHGPVVDGKDLFKTAMTDALGRVGVSVDFIEDWDEYHVGSGEVHCGTNTTRTIPQTKWWESGR